MLLEKEALEVEKGQVLIHTVLLTATERSQELESCILAAFVVMSSRYMISSSTV